MQQTLAARVAGGVPGVTAWLDDAGAMSFSSSLRCDTQGFAWGGDSGMALLAWGLNIFWICLALSPAAINGTLLALGWWAGWEQSVLADLVQGEIMQVQSQLIAECRMPSDASAHNTT